jgi:hypothetical protein
VKPSGSAKQGPKNRGPRADTSLEKLTMLYPVLMSCAFDRSTPSEEAKSDQFEKFYESTIRKLKDAFPNQYVAVCEFSAGQRHKDTKILDIQATYVFGFRYEDKDISDTNKRHVLKEIAESSVWPLFRNLFIHIGSQSGEELPLLPNLPTLAWRESEE